MLCTRYPTQGPTLPTPNPPGKKLLLTINDRRLGAKGVRGYSTINHIFFVQILTQYFFLPIKIIPTEIIWA